MSDTRPHAPQTGDERATLNGFLDFLRATVVMKVEGLTDEQSRLPRLDSSPLMTPAGVVKHLTAVERWWLSLALANDDCPSCSTRRTATSSSGWVTRTPSPLDLLREAIDGQTGE